MREHLVMSLAILASQIIIGIVTLILQDRDKISYATSMAITIGVYLLVIIYCFTR